MLSEKRFGYREAGVARQRLGVVWRWELSLDALETWRRGGEIANYLSEALAASWVRTWRKHNGGSAAVGRIDS